MTHIAMLGWPTAHELDYGMLRPSEQREASGNGMSMASVIKVFIPLMEALRYFETVDPSPEP